jgi:hypothetical protein
MILKILAITAFIAVTLAGLQLCPMPHISFKYCATPIDVIKPFVGGRPICFYGYITVRRE